MVFSKWYGQTIYAWDQNIISLIAVKSYLHVVQILAYEALVRIEIRRIINVYVILVLLVKFDSSEVLLLYLSYR